jgi:hypothetical protein
MPVHAMPDVNTRKFYGGSNVRAVRKPDLDRRKGWMPAVDRTPRHKTCPTCRRPVEWLDRCARCAARMRS